MMYSKRCYFHICNQQKPLPTPPVLKNKFSDFIFFQKKFSTCHKVKHAILLFLLLHLMSSVCQLLRVDFLLIFTCNKSFYIISLLYLDKVTYFDICFDIATAFL